MAEFARRSSDAWSIMTPSVFTFEGPTSPSQQQQHHPRRPSSAAVRQKDALSVATARKARLVGRVGSSPVGTTTIPTPTSARWHAVSAIPNSYSASGGETRVSSSSGGGDTAAAVREFGLPASTHIGVVSTSPTTTNSATKKVVRPASSKPVVYGMLQRRRATIESISDSKRAFPGAVIDGKLRNTAARMHSRNNNDNNTPLFPNMVATTNSRQVALLPRPPPTTSNCSITTLCPGHLLIPSYAQPLASRRQSNLNNTLTTTAAHLTQNAPHLRDGLVSVGSYRRNDDDDVVCEEEPVLFGDPARHIIPRVGFAAMPTTNSPRTPSISPRGAVWR